MINTQISSLLASNNPKNETKESKESKEKLSSKDSLTQALKHNLGKELSHNELLEKILNNQTGEKLKELIDKLLVGLNSGKNPNSPLLKQGNMLNFAPNFANELQMLSTELEKSDIFSEVLSKLKEILKPASEVKTNNIATLLKNSGVFFETKLKNSLNQELLPQSFHKLLNAIKSLSDEKFKEQITMLAAKDLTPKESLATLKELITNAQSQNKEILNQSKLKDLLSLSKKLENFKNFISKNPSLAQEKSLKIVDKLLKELSSAKNDFSKVLRRTENLMLKDTNILKQSLQAFEKLEQNLKNIKQELTKKQEINTKAFIPTKLEEKNAKELIPTKLEEKNQNIPKEQDSENKQIKTKEESQNTNIKNKEESQNTKNETKDQIKENTKQEFKQNQKEILKDNTKDNIQEGIKEGFKEKIAENVKTPSQENLQNNTTNTFKTGEVLKENGLKNLIFSSQTQEFDMLENLSKDIAKLTRKLNESIKQLEPQSQNARVNLDELRNLDHKLEHSLKDLKNIKIKSEQDIINEIKNDVKSNLLQISNLAKQEANEAVYNTANRLLAQIEINQLMSLANDSINTYLPFFWEDLNDSKVIFRRGKKDKFFAQIKLEFAKLGGLEILICLNNEKYIDINIMAENKGFRKIIYENAHELKRNINKAGLLSANFFVGDIIHSKFNTKNLKNYDLQMGMDKKV